MRRARADDGFLAGFALFARLVFGIVRPRRTILGSSFSGVVEAVGTHVRGIAPGDEVCGMTGVKLGAHAEYVAVPANKLARKPSAVSHEDAAGWCPERRVRDMRDALKGAFRSLNALNAPFRTPAMS